MRAESKEVLRRFAMNDERFVASVTGRGPNIEAFGLDQKTHALVRLGALLAIEATVNSYQPNIAMALAAGASVDEIIGTLVAVAPDVGAVRPSPPPPSWRWRSGTTSPGRSRARTRTSSRGYLMPSG